MHSVCTEGRPREDAMNAVIFKSWREATEDTQPAHTWTLDLEPSELWENRLSLKPPILWCFVMAVGANQYSLLVENLSYGCPYANQLPGPVCCHASFSWFRPLPSGFCCHFGRQLPPWLPTTRTSPTCWTNTVPGTYRHWTHVARAALVIIIV